MSDIEAAVAQRTRVEFEQTQAAFDRVREAMIEKLVSSHVTQSDVREKLYFAIQTLDAVRKAMMEAMSSGDVEQYAEEIRKRGIAA